MIDLHCHIIFETDDGAKDLKDSVNILREAYEAGFTKICCTPHYIVPQYIKTKSENEEKLNIIREALEKEGIEIELFLGNEVYIADNMKELLDKNIISCMADSKYVLVELPLTQKLLGAEDMIDSLVYKGYTVILAHPERYVYAQKDLKFFDEYIEKGVYLQGNYESLLGKYGMGAQKALKKLLKDQKIDLMATDTHKEKSTYTKMKKILKVLKRYAKNDYYEYITEECPEKILKNL